MNRPDDFARQVWAGEGGAVGAALRLALAPAEAVFRGVVAARNGAYDRGWLRSERVDVPVISIGNVSVGGAGKTPFAAWLARRLADWGRKPAIALRGYGEDEIVLHRELNPDIPVFRGRRRVEAAREAVAAGRDVIVLDDAFQHRALARDLDLVLIPVEGWEPRPRVLPRGPWREGVQALARADLIVLTRKSATRCARAGGRGGGRAAASGEARRPLRAAAVAARPAARRGGDGDGCARRGGGCWPSRRWPRRSRSSRSFARWGRRWRRRRIRTIILFPRMTRGASLPARRGGCW